MPDEVAKQSIDERISKVVERIDELEKKLIERGDVSAISLDLITRLIHNAIHLDRLEQLKWEEDNPVTLEECEAWLKKAPLLLGRQEKQK